jgi:uncharacterized protein (DUF2235 family)
MGKRLVICCDGTWKRPDQAAVSNIERIARAVDTTSAATTQQVVYYASGVGTGATRSERLLGGAFGLGLDTGIVNAYRFLALNYETGDEVFVFGFSRGAYTARSLVGMIGLLGLLTPKGVVGEHLPEAIALYRSRDEAGITRFRQHTHPGELPVHFLGVFDTVGALGLPGTLSRRKYAFHDVRLGQHVLCARHALALDERRMAFAPAVWMGPDAHARDDVVKQVWFDGVHSDVGGGYAKHPGLANLTLLWMLREARAAGLEIAQERLPDLQDREPYVHDSLRGPYRLFNALTRVALRLGLSPAKALRFRGRHRVLETTDADGNHDLNVLIADVALARWDADEARRKAAPQVGTWVEKVPGARTQVEALDFTASKPR